MDNPTGITPRPDAVLPHATLSVLDRIDYVFLHFGVLSCVSGGTVFRDLHLLARCAERSPILCGMLVERGRSVLRRYGPVARVLCCQFGCQVLGDLLFCFSAAMFPTPNQDMCRVILSGVGLYFGKCTCTFFDQPADLFHA